MCVYVYMFVHNYIYVYVCIYVCNIYICVYILCKLEKCLQFFFYFLQFHGPLLTLVDLVDLCVDISKGCVYLEQMHFIHRYSNILDARFL